MKSYLDEIIEAYQVEKDRIDLLIHEALKEEDYLSAHFHSNSLRHINHKLQVFNLLKDPQYDHKVSLTRMITHLQAKQIELGINYGGFLAGMKAELEALNQRQALPVIDTQYIDDAVFDLADGRLNSFRLILIREQNLVLTFKLTRNNLLEISFPMLSDVKERSILEYKLPQLTSLGFISHSPEQLIYFYDMTNFKDALQLKELLSKIIFDVYHFMELDHPLTLERE